MVKGLNVRCFRFAAGHGCKNTVHAGQQQTFLHQPGQGAAFCLRAEGIQRQEKRFCLWVSAGHKGVIEGAFFLLRPDLGQVLRREAKYRACQHAEQRNILPGVHYRLQQAAEGADFLSLQQVRAASGGAMDAKSLQRPLEVSPGAAGRPEQNHNVSGLYRTQRVPVPNQCAGSQHITDSFGNKGRFLRVSIRHGFQRVQLYAGVRQWDVGHALPEGFRVRIVESSDFRGHTGGKHMIDAFDHLRTGTEIMAEQHLSALLRLGFFGGCVGFVLFKENPRVCQPKLIDGLLYIAYQKTVLLFPAQRGKDCVLHAVGILILVHQYFSVSAADFRRSGSGIGSGFAQ